MITKYKNFKESLNINEEEDSYYEIAWDKFEKMMPDDSEIQGYFYDIIDDDNDINSKIEDLYQFLVDNIDEDLFYEYAGNNASLKEFAEYIIELH